jgi:hypothetical protein
MISSQKKDLKVLELSMLMKPYSLTEPSETKRGPISTRTLK